ncbi:MAG: HAMP domain-containing protein [Pseudomonadota bacterium]|nr:HAMP domain-containing protein [Pseudomonadota bacterium]
MQIQIDVAKQDLSSADEFKDVLVSSITALTFVAAVIAALSTWTVLAGVIRPINLITAAMQRLAQGNLEAIAVGNERKDEIGHMAAAMQIFREAAIAKKRLEAEAESNHQRAEAERISTQQSADSLAMPFSASQLEIISITPKYVPAMELAAAIRSNTFRSMHSKTSPKAPKKLQAVLSLERIAVTPSCRARNGSGMARTFVLSGLPV